MKEKDINDGLKEVVGELIKFEDDNPHCGHRRRMFDKMEKGFLLPHEILEVLLYFVYPRTNTNPIAHALLDKFETIENVFNARESELMKVEDIGENVAGFLNLIGKCMQYSHTCSGFSTLKNNNDLNLFIRARSIKAPINHVEIFCLTDEYKILRVLPFEPTLQGYAEVNFKEFVKMVDTLEVAKIYITRYTDKPTAELDDYDFALIKKAMSLCSIHDLQFCDYLVYSQECIRKASENEKFNAITQYITTCMLPRLE